MMPTEKINPDQAVADPGNNPVLFLKKMEEHHQQNRSRSPGPGYVDR